MIKKIVIGFAALVVILVIAGGYLFSNLDSYIKAAVEKYGSAATQTTVKLNGVSLSLTTGEGSLKGLSVGSPSGFAASKALYLGLISVTLDTKSATGTGPIIIKQMIIDKPQVTYEVTTSGDSNLQTIARNTQSYASSFAGKTGQKPAELATPSAPAAPARKIIIDSLTISDGQISITQPLLQGRQLDAPLPTIHLSNIGKGEGGATPAEVARTILGAITQSASQVAATSLTKELGNLNLGNLKNIPGGVVGGATDTVGKAGDQIKNLFGQ